MVAAKVACTNCWSFLRASRMVVGRRVRCPKCKKAFQVRPIGDDYLNHRERIADVAELSNAVAQPRIQLQPRVIENRRFWYLVVDE